MGICSRNRRWSKPRRSINHRTSQGRKSTMQTQMTQRSGRDESSVALTNGHENAISIPTSVKNTQLRAWVLTMTALCQPARIHWCDGSQQEYAALCEELVQAGT